MIRAIGFDLDDTLYEHVQYVKGAYWDVALAAERLAGVPAEAFFRRIYADWQKLTSRCNHIFADGLVAYDVYSPVLEQYLVEVYRAHHPTLRPYPGVMRGLMGLKRVGFLLGLLTDGQVQVQRRKLKALGLEKLFDAGMYTGSLGRAFYKPHQTGFLQLANELGVKPAAMAYVGDNPLTDFESPKRMGMHTIRVLTGEYKHLQPNTEWVDRTFADINQAMTWLLTCKEMA